MRLISAWATRDNRTLISEELVCGYTLGRDYYGNLV
jgi:hypothetical protein